jgi:sulfane dehydrogenase subunit SoxC
VRAPIGVVSGTTLTPLQDLTGTITPSDLHYERIHAGVPLIDPERHTLTIHGLVDHPIVFTLEELKRFPSVSRIHFMECSGNGRDAYRTPTPTMTPQQVDGMVSNTEWTGVLLSTLMREAGIRANAKWMLAEGGDACLMARSIPVEKGLDDALIAYGQNGEALRPSNGYPIRLVLPGWEGNTNVKWIRRIEVGTDPWMTRWETSKYTDPLTGGKARMFAFVMDAKSIITSPAYPRVLNDRGWWPITGLAWSGRGVVTGVEVSTDAGKTWHPAVLQDPTLPRALTRFMHMWQWDGRETVIMSRAYDDTGYVQPDRGTFRKVRGAGTDYHFNYIRAWRIKSDGSVTFEAET